GLGRLHLSGIAGGIREDGHANDPGNDLFQQLQPLSGQLAGKVRQPCDISAGPRETRDQPGPYGVRVDWHDDRYRAGGTLGRLHGAYPGDNDVHLEANEVGGESRESFVSSLRPAVLNADVSSLVVAEITQTLPERFDQGVGRRAGAEDADPVHLPRLRLG